MNKCFLGDCRDTMRKLIADGVRVQCIVTSPPYWGLRDYGVDGQLGLEPTLREFLDNLVEVFSLCRQLLSDDGTLWLNMGDSYAGAGNGMQGKHGERFDRAQAPRPPRRGTNAQFKPKDLIGQPWRLAFALQDDGWWLRQDIIWNKPNPMPESVRDRCTKAHEYIFLLSRSERYYFDQEAILEPVSPNTHARLSQNVQAQIGSERAYGGAKANGNMKAVGRGNYPAGWARDTEDKKSLLGRYDNRGVTFGHGTDAEKRGRGRVKNNDSFNAAMAIMPTQRNKRSVWTIPTESFSGAHFATFPQALVEPCILAGSRVNDIVFDPFLGSGTVAQVAQRLGRQWIGCELNPDYVALQADRTRQLGMML